MWRPWNQLKAILWKNWLLKKAHMAGFLAELLLPVAFMGLLILIKTITSVYDSPNVAYFCGNTYPWFYNTFPVQGDALLDSVPYVCTQKPATCTLDHYYEESGSYMVNNNPDDVLSAYGQYGYIESGLSSGTNQNPFYSFTIADNAPIYQNGVMYMENPSLPFCQMMGRMDNNEVILGVAPEDGSSTDLNQKVADFRNYLITYCSAYYDFSSSIVTFTSAGNMDDYMTDRDYDDKNYRLGKIGFGIVLIKTDTNSAQWEYSIRSNYTSMWDTNDPTVACLYGSCDFMYTIPTTKFYTMDLYKPQSSEYLYGYSYSGFSTLQVMVDQFIMSHYVPADAPPASVKASVGLMPTVDYKTDNFQYVISSTLGIFYMLSFLYPVSRIIRSLVLEKECRIKEGMKMMGLSDTVYNSSWAITTLLQMTLVSILITLITATSVFEYSNKFLVFLYFEAFSLAVINLCFLLSSFFSRSKSASLLGPMIFFGAFFPYYAVNDPQFDTSSKTAACLLAPACFGLGANVLADYEGGLVGVQLDNINQETSNFTYSACLTMLLVDAVLYGVLAWYFDKVLPSEFGTPLPWYFPVTPSYWCGVKMSSKRQDNSLWGQILGFFGSRRHRYSSIGAAEEFTTPITDGNGRSSSVGQKHLLEPVSSDLLQQKADESCVQIQKLRRVFKNNAGGDDKIAVHGLDLDLYLNQVTVLLGHNGAGKSTTISMLVGLIPPSEGDAVMPGGLLLSEDMAMIRNTLGVCPQHDILFTELTPMQHLMMFASFKGVASNEVEKAAKNMLSELNLLEKAHARAGSLSGGQKRKLSLGMALIGDSKVIVLDEPTSGMDPYSRRSTWSIIQRHKKGRVILLTTHFMDEADLLGDRIAIMSHGRLICCGSSLFLKNSYGVGYTMTIVKNMVSNADNTSGHDGNADISEGIRKVVRAYVPEAEPLSDIGAELSLRLPFAASASFVDLFHAIDSRKEQLSVAEYGISVTTLEEVFIRVGHSSGADGIIEEEGHQVEEIDDHHTGVNPVLDLSGSGLGSGGIALTAGAAALPKKDEQLKHITNVRDHDAPLHEADALSPDKNLFFTHFSALLVKRAIYAKRDRRMLFCQLVLPVVLVIIGLALLLIRPDLSQPDYVLSASDFNAKKDSSVRNFVPMNVENDCGQLCYDIVSRFNGNPDSGVYGVAVPIYQSGVVLEDSFGGCSQGAELLYNTSQYLMQTPDAELDEEDGSSRYGAVTLGSMTNGSLLNYNALINGSAIHGVGVYMNLVHQAYLQSISNIPTAKIITHNYPLPMTYQQDNQSATTDAFVVALFVLIAICFIPTSFVVFVVKEREVKAKHQQIISGVSIYAYWMSTYLWDVLSYIPTGGMIMAMMAAFDITAFDTGPAAATLVVGLALYGPSTAAITYLLSFLFKSHSTSQVAIMFFNFLTGLCLSIVSFILTAIPSTCELNVYLRYIFRLFPSYCLGDCFLQLSLCTEGTDCPVIDKNGYDMSNTVSPWNWNTTGGNLTFMAIESVVYFIIVVLIEVAQSYPALMADLNPVQDPGLDYQKLVSHEDLDVHAERERVLGNPHSNEIIRIEQLRKVYPMGTNMFGMLYNICINLSKMIWKRCMGGDDATAAARQGSRQSQDTLRRHAQANGLSSSDVKVAVQCLTFGIPRGECFGFLGINGAGKTTTLSILSGELTPSSGTAHINGFDIISQQRQIRQLIGYCPQFDALFELLTVQEHLELYARIKGLSKLGKDKFEANIEKKIKELNLTIYRDKLAGSLSGGNKRKLSVAIATIGDPPIVFLDEPSSGMDPVARRFMWKVIARMSTQESRCSVMLTTHSMEEAEALCTRIGVMVNGQLQCLGSAQHLKHRFGQGYEVTLKLQTPTEAVVHELLSKMRNAGLFSRDAQAAAIEDVEGGKAHSHDVWENYRIRRTMLPRIGQALGNPQRLAGIENYVSHISTNALEDTINTSILLLEGLLRAEDNGENRVIDAATLAANASMSAQQFAEYWLLEDRFDSLTAFLQSEFGPRAVLIERSSSQACRYRIVRSKAGEVQKNDLADVFAKFEQHKEQLGIHEYSVGQTTLEQIFNQFAAKQHSEE